MNSESLDFRLFVEKNEKKYRVCYTIEFFCIFAVTKSNGPLAQLNRVFDYGSKGYRFESCRGHEKRRLTFVKRLFFRGAFRGSLRQFQSRLFFHQIHLHHFYFDAVAEAVVVAVVQAY